MNKLKLVGLTILLVLIAGIAYWYFIKGKNTINNSNTSTEQSQSANQNDQARDWFKYNAAMGYEVKYPPDLWALDVGGATGVGQVVLKDVVLFTTTDDFAKIDEVKKANDERCAKRGGHCSSDPFAPEGLYLNVFDNEKLVGYDEAAKLFATHKDQPAGSLYECTNNSSVYPEQVNSKERIAAKIYIKQFAPRQYVMVCATSGYDSMAQVMLSTFIWTR